MSKRSGGFKAVEKEKELSTEVSIEAVQEEKKVHVNRPNRLPRSQQEKLLLLSNLTSKGMKMEDAKKIAYQD